ncbi:MAG: hypothetical protein M1831_001531 [Alyxoria varia]|nr:MAG: hypothetical protein M1831_001531 [Alyxoria varia]
MPMRDPDLPKDDISPPFELATSALRSPEDNVSLWQFMTVSWMSPLISVGYKRQLNDEDVWKLSYQFQHSRLLENFREVQGSVVKRLMKANGLDLTIQTILGIIENLGNFAAPVLLQQLLRSMEDITAPKRATIIYAVLTLVARLIASQAACLGLWFSRRSYERSRGEMITMLYEKTLSRKTLGFVPESKEEKESQEDDGYDGMNGHALSSPKSSNRVKDFFDRIRKSKLIHLSCLPRQKQQVTKHETNQPASLGKILNLMRNDVYEVSQRFWEFQQIVLAPFNMIVSIALIWKLIGWPCLIGAVAIIVAQVANAFIARIILKRERIRRVALDIRLKATTEFVDAIRHLRWYGWQDAWLSKILDARQRELDLRVINSLWGQMISFTNTLSKGMFPVIAFWAYTTLAGKPLYVDTLFPAYSLFNMLSNSMRFIPHLIVTLLNSFVAVGRIENFMDEPDKQEIDTHDELDSKLSFRNASFVWPGSQVPVLKDVNLSFSSGLTVICGKVGSGKSAMLQALLGELDKTDGQLVRPDEVYGYCAQKPWLQSASIRENILFQSPYDDVRYKQVLEACALTTDFANFKHGDLSNIGENGIGLSGGQKARVALARAIYSRAKILLLDDPISALDYQTAETIVRKCLQGPLLEGRTTILVTHRTELVHTMAEQVVEINDGYARILGSEATFPKNMSLSMSAEHAEGEITEPNQEEQDAAVPERFIEDEHRATGGVKARVYWEYIKAGTIRWWIGIVVVIAVYRLIAVAESWYLKQWGEAYRQQEVQSDPIITDIFDHFPPPQDNVRPWLIGFAMIGVASAVAYLISRIVMLVIIYTAGKQMFLEIMKRVSFATFQFYDKTPVGRLMNRLTSDIGTIDGNISDQFQMVAWLAILWVSSLIVIASVTPAFLVFSLVLTVSFVIIFLRFLPTSQSLRRLEMVSLSPLMSNFGALVEGLTTVRAFCAQGRFQDRAIVVTDAFQKMDHFFWTLQAWLQYRFDVLSAFSTLILTLLALFTGVSPGLTAFVLVASSGFVDATHSICRQYGQLQMDFVSVERVVELLHLEQESSGSVKPPARWPSYAGDIVFDHVTIRYAPHLEPALSSISLRIKAGSNTAIVGRTGSGKTTLALSLIATMVPESGQISIDSVDISSVDKQALRTRVTFLAQEPLLFPGTMRQNLDPLNEHSDDECTGVLSRIFGGVSEDEGSDAQQRQWTLGTQIDSGGDNLSQGQRQLVGLARAILRRSPIVILDEATASIDLVTALRMQQILREELQNATVITIAHRLEAVQNADYCIALGKGGTLLGHGPAAQMLKDVGSEGLGIENGL